MFRDSHYLATHRPRFNNQFVDPLEVMVDWRFEASRGVTSELTHLELSMKKRHVGLISWMKSCRDGIHFLRVHFFAMSDLKADFRMSLT